MNPVLIVDADPAVYAASFAAQRSTYEYVYEDENGQVHHTFWASGSEANAFFRAHKDYVVLSKDKHVEVESESHARQCCKTMFRTMFKRMAQHWNVDRSNMSTEFYLTGGENFRYKLATITPYKANRPDRPVHYQTVRDFIMDTYGAVVVAGQEADDAVSIRCRELAADGRPFVLATIDKDLDQVPGPHYDYRQHVFYDVSKTDAHRMFWRQVLSGDRTDTIQGLYRVGESKAEELIDTWLEETGRPRSLTDLDRMIWPLVVLAYAENMARYPDKYPAGMTPEAAALENARLVKMREFEGEIWTPTF